MSRRTRSLRAIVAMTGALVAGVVTSPVAQASQPDTVFIDFDHNVRVLPAGGPYCSFPVERVLDGRLWDRVYAPDADGTVRDIAWVSDFTYTLRNPANGRELRSVLAGTVTTYVYADGSVRSVVAGNDINFTVPGEGRLTGYVGRYEELLSGDGDFTVLAQTHNFADSVFPAACAYLG
ncbi:MAG: hypothetical protein IPF90_06400 [Actinomycetales bacterium]|nr:hypothetical protein [Candidatus Phosphoribacter baldrii]